MTDYQSTISVYQNILEIVKAISLDSQYIVVYLHRILIKDMLVVTDEVVNGRPWKKIEARWWIWWMTTEDYDNKLYLKINEKNV